MKHSRVETQQFVLTSHLDAVQNLAITLPANLDTTQQKKRARKELSVLFTSETVGFLHAVLVCIDEKYYALAGKSGIGKTTYASKLQPAGESGFLASDWIAVEKQNGSFFASDLNFSQGLKGSRKVELSGVLFLSSKDEYRRDAFFPTDAELDVTLQETFDTATPQELETLASFWKNAVLELPICCVVPARASNEKYVLGSIQRVISLHEQSLQSLAVGVIGLGAVGTQVAAQVGSMPSVKQVHLYNRSPEKAVGLALDMNHGNPEAGERFTAHSEMAAVFENASVVFLTFRDDTVTQAENVPERWMKVSTHLKIMQEISQTAAQTNFQGVIFVITNPVDFLAYSLYAQSQNTEAALRTFQVYGVGLELDAVRALHYSKQLPHALDITDISLFGNHSDEFVLETPLVPEENNELLRLVTGGSKEVRQFVPRTVYGPASIAKRTLEAYVQGSQVHVAVIQEGAYMGRLIAFRNNLPQLAHKPKEESEYKRILDKNKTAVTEFLEQ